MKIIVISLLVVFLASLLVVPVFLITLKEKSNNKNLPIVHIACNTLFLIWAFYDINYTQHYSLGPNTLFIIIPGTIGLFLYYLFGYRRVLKVPKIPRHAFIIACMHIVFIIYGITILALN